MTCFKQYDRVCWVAALNEEHGLNAIHAEAPIWHHKEQDSKSRWLGLYERPVYKAYCIKYGKSEAVGIMP